MLGNFRLQAHKDTEEKANNPAGRGPRGGRGQLVGGGWPWEVPAGPCAGGLSPSDPGGLPEPTPPPSRGTDGTDAGPAGLSALLLVPRTDPGSS